MSIRTLKTFVSIAKHGTFAAAAKEIGLTQAGVSLQIRTLEKELNAKLFDRVGRVAILNTSGRNLVSIAKKIIDLYENMPLLVNAGDLGGTLSIGATPPSFANLLPDAVLALKHEYPRIEVKISSGISDDLAARVERGELDAAIVSDPPEPLSHTLVLHKVEQQPLVLITPKSLKLTNAREILSREPFIRFTQHAWTGRRIERTMRELNIKVNNNMELDTPEVIAEMVARGFGVSIIPLYEGKWKSDLRLKIWRLIEPRMERGISLVERRTHNRATLTAALLRHLLNSSSANSMNNKLPTLSLA